MAVYLASNTRHWEALGLGDSAGQDLTMRVALSLQSFCKVLQGKLLLGEMCTYFAKTFRERTRQQEIQQKDWLFILIPHCCLQASHCHQQSMGHTA